MAPIRPNVAHRGRCPKRSRFAALVGTASLLAGCSVFAAPKPGPVSGASLAPVGLVGYVVCPDAVSPVELATGVAEPPIHLPVTGTPALGNFAITTSADGRWAYVVTTTAGSTASVGSGSAGAESNVVIPIDLARQQASKPIAIPGQGGTRAIVMLANGRTLLAASGTTIVPVDAVTHAVGTPLDLGANHTVDGMVIDPRSAMVYVLVPGAVVPVDTTTAEARPAIPTGLTVSSVASPHGLAITGDGATVYVAGQGGTDFGGRVVPVAAAASTALPATSFDRFGISDPAAVAVSSDGTTLFVVDPANDWLVPVPLASFTTPGSPIRLPQTASTGPGGRGTQHPTDVVAVPGATTAFVVEGYDAVVPYVSHTQRFGHPITVCQGASSMAVAPAP